MGIKNTSGRSFGRFLGVAKPGRNTEQKAREEEVSLPTDDRRAGWGFHRSTIAEYGQVFHHVLPDQFMGDFLRELVVVEGYRSILDIMASESVVAEAVNGLGFKYGVAVSLGFKHETTWDKKFGKGVVRTVNGDITFNDTWSNIQAQRDIVSPNGFDVILSRAEGGLENKFIPDNEVLYYLLLQKIWNIAAPRGTIILQVPNANVYDARRYFEQLWSESIEVHLPPPAKHSNSGFPYAQKAYYGYPVRIEKRVGNPRRLPKPGFLRPKPKGIKEGLKLVGL